MVKLKKIKKRRVAIVLLIIMVIIYGIVRSKNYVIEYTKNNVIIKESYDRKEKSYNFLFTVNDKEFIWKVKSKYYHVRKLVESIEVKQDEETICILPKGKKIDFYPLCYQKNELVSYHLISNEEIIPQSYYKEIASSEITYDKITVHYLNNRKYFIWNYKGFYVVDDKGIQEIKLFDNDIYNIPLTIQLDNYILMADYSSKFVFNKFYVINSNNNKLRELSLENDISFESYFLGTTNKKAYLVDKKNKKEYEIYPKRLLIENITNNNQGKILIEDEWNAITLNALINTESKFTHKDMTHYEIKNNNLYAIVDDYEIKLNDKVVKEIIYYDDTTVYYLVDDKLYYYNITDGEVLVLSNFEWNFNYKNMIYIF